MRNLLAFLAAAVLAFAGLGWYLDWYKIQSVPSATPGHQSYTVELNETKMQKDAKPIKKEIVKSVEGFIDKKATEANTPAAAPKPSAAPASNVPSAGVERPNGIQ